MIFVRRLLLTLGLIAVSAIAQDTNSLSRFEAVLKNYREYTRTNPPPTGRFESPPRIRA